MKVYRVYEGYHANDEAGTYEYGYFSTLEKAADRVKDVWEKKQYPSDYQVDERGGRFVNLGWDDCEIRVRPIEVDVPTEDDCCIFT
jgi:hypothetical protein